jgi:hypothetical protein
MLNDAIRTAQTEHVIYFLLTAYVETLDYYDPPRSCLPSCVNRLPIVGNGDVTERLRALRETLDSNVQDSSDVRAILQEALDLFDTAWQRLQALDMARLTIVEQGKTPGLVENAGPNTPRPRVRWSEARYRSPSDDAVAAPGIPPDCC